jgi:hypothetical protein
MVPKLPYLECGEWKAQVDQISIWELQGGESYIQILGNYVVPLRNVIAADKEGQPTYKVSLTALRILHGSFKPGLYPWPSKEQVRFYKLLRDILRGPMHGVRGPDNLNTTRRNPTH